MAKTLYGKKKTMRIVLFCLIAALVIAAVVLLVALTQRDGAGMNCFQRNATAATADGESVNMSEYRVTYDMLVSNYQSYGTTSFSEDDIRTLQETAAQQALMQKIYPKEAKALGLSLTDEQKAAAKTAAQNQIDQIRKYYTDNLVSNGSYSKSAVEKQIANYYQQLGMTEGQYRSFLEQSTEANYYSQAIEAYYQENGSDIPEDALLDFYRKSVEDSMYTEDADGVKQPTYADGQYWNYLSLYAMGYSTPMLYVPEGFIYVDFIKIEKGSTEEAQEVINKINAGELSFDDLMNSEDNKDTFRGLLEGPYPIAQNDHSALFSENEAYTQAAALAVGEIGSFVGQAKSDDDGVTTVTAYLFRRANGTMCMDGETGVINIDYYDGIRTDAENQYRMKQWVSDIRYDDKLYAYKGALG